MQNIINIAKNPEYALSAKNGDQFKIGDQTFQFGVMAERHCTNIGPELALQVWLALVPHSKIGRDVYVRTIYPTQFSSNGLGRALLSRVELMEMLMKREYVIS